MARRVHFSTPRAFLVNWPGLTCADCGRDIDIGTTALVTAPAGERIYRHHHCGPGRGDLDRFLDQLPPR